MICKKIFIDSISNLKTPIITPAFKKGEKFDAANYPTPHMIKIIEVSYQKKEWSKILRQTTS